MCVAGRGWGEWAGEPTQGEWAGEPTLRFRSPSAKTIIASATDSQSTCATRAAAAEEEVCREGGTGAGGADGG